MSKLSIITINLNNASGLRKTIESVVNQTFTDYEYLIIDGGSTDDSVDVIMEYADNINYWVSEPDKGIYNAMNKGILKSKGEYLQFLNSGDWLIDNDVLKNIFYIHDSKCDIIYGDLARTFPDGKKDILKMPGEITPTFLYSASLAHPISFIKRDLFLKYGFYDESYKIAADHAFFVKVILTGNTSLKHKGIIVANFNMDGLCSKIGNQSQIKDERNRAFNEQLSPTYLKLIIEFQICQYYFEKLKIREIIKCLRGCKRIISKLKFIYKNFH